MTEETNEAMRRQLERVSRLSLEELDQGLRRYVEGGLAIDTDGAIIAVAARPASPLPEQLLGDTVAIEAWCNKIHVDDWCTEQLASSPVEEKLAHALVLADCVGKLAIDRGVSVAVVIAIDADDVVFCFHGLRAGDFPWASDVDEYAEPVLIRRYVASNDGER